MTKLQKPEDRYCEAFLDLTDPTLKRPIEILSHYTDQTAKEIVLSAVIVYLEGSLDDILPELRKSLEKPYIEDLENILAELEAKRPIFKKPFLK